MSEEVNHTLKKNDVLNYSRSEIWSFYIEIGETERHFNVTQEKYRLLASTWLLGTIGAIAFIFSNEGDFPFPPTLLGAALAFIASVGIALLWILDIKVYQTLLSSYYAEGLLLEQAQPWLPQIRGRVRDRFKGTVPLLLSTYYIGSMLFLFVIGVGGLSLSFSKKWASEVAVVSVFALLDLIVLIAVIFQSPQSKEVISFESDEKRLQVYSQAIVKPPKLNK
ncbi:hypothetical protein [Candidatus Leptofilum sp.]|uniref:hypothetical protein n=1 Tax=Candidatus Leptofilum sp. TaxID=3241576 RepID=UPI003B5B8F21